MIRRRQFVLLPVALGWTSRALAQEARGRRIVGDVVLVRPTRMHVKSVGERSYTILVNRNTQVRRGDTPISLADVKVGERVVVDVASDSEPWVARVVLCRP